MSSYTRVAAVVAGVAATGLMAGPAFASAPAKTPTSLTLKAAHASVAPKHKDALTLTLKAGNKRLAGETVYVEKRTAGAAKFGKLVMLSKQTDAKGQVTFSVVPGTKKGHKEQYEVVFKGTSKYKASHSHVLTVTVS